MILQTYPSRGERRRRDLWMWRLAVRKLREFRRFVVGLFAGGDQQRSIRTWFRVY